MNPLHPIGCILMALILTLASARADVPAAPIPLPAALESRQLTMTASGNGRDALTLTLTNPSAVPVAVTIPAGLIVAGTSPDSRMVIVRFAATTVPAQGVVDASLPVAALSSKNVIAAQPCHLETGAEPRLTALLTTLADQPDAPRATVQLAVLGLLENVNFAQWRQFLGAGAGSPPTPAEITQAIDALGLLRATEPQRTFALGDDTELKLRALRNPWSRAKAVALYGLDTGDAATPPDLRQLLHTQAGDNCPICRQRALMQKQGDIP